MAGTGGTGVTITKDLGGISSYAIAVEAGYQGTKAQWVKHIQDVTTNAVRAELQALIAEGFSSGTQGGEPVEQGSPYETNNAKYWKEQAELVVSHYPYTYNDTWWVWDVSTQQFVDTHVLATGNDHTILIQEEQPDEEVNKLWIPAGEYEILTIPSMEDIAAIDTKADKANPVFTGSVSMNRWPNTTVGVNSIALGYYNRATGECSFAIGRSNTASSAYAYAEGNTTTASGTASHAQGSDTVASGFTACAEGYNTTASGDHTHAEGVGTIASLPNMHASGSYNITPSVFQEWVSETPYQVGDCVSHANVPGGLLSGYRCKTANSDTNFTPSKWDLLPTTGDTLFAVGNGTGTNKRSNAMTVYHDGTVKAQTALKIGNTTITEAQLQALLAMLT